MRISLAMLALGAGFGFVLGWARLSDPDVIHAMLKLAEPDVFLIMGSAIAVAAIGVRVLRAWKAKAVLEGSPVRWTTVDPTREHVLGSMLFGLGWSVSCACPGPIAVQLGRGEISGAFTALGFLGGIAIREAWKERATGVAAREQPDCGGIEAEPQVAGL